MIAPTNITAVPDPRGGAVMLSWTTPILPGFTGTRVLRRENEFPLVLADVRTSQNVVYIDTSTAADGTGQFVDTGLKSETTYYYAIVAFDADFRPFPAYVSVMTTAPYQTAAYLYRNIPEIYRTNDTVTSSTLRNSADAGKGQLLRLIEMFGLHFDMLRSFARGMQSFFDPNRIDGRLLPLMAQWIGWQTNDSAPIARQRNEIKFAPHNYATTGLAVNLRASISRLVTWNVQIKEFVHNIFLSNRPEELTIYEMQRRGGPWQPARNVSLDVAYEGRLFALIAADGRSWIFHHARQGAPGNAPDRWHVWCKVFDRGGWLPAHRLTGDAAINKYPAAVQRTDGSVLLFWSRIDTDAPGRPIPQLRMQQLAAGRPALNVQVQSPNAGPFSFADGDVFKVTIGTVQVPDITLRAEHFANIAQATADETAAVIDRELPGVDVTATADGRIAFSSRTSGVGSQLTFPNSAVGTKLGVVASVGADAVPAQLTGTREEPFALAQDDTLVITMDSDVPCTVTFAASQTSAVQVAAAINQILPGVAAPAEGRIQLASQRPGALSFVSVDVNFSSAASKLGFSAQLPPPAQAVDETEPSALRDAAGNVWLFWSSRRNGQWQIWYSRFDGSSWGSPKPLTTLLQPDREPFALFDPANTGRIWVFWSRKKDNGLWNIFFRTTTKLDFDDLTNEDWTEIEMKTSADTNYDNREPAAMLSGTGSVDLYFASNRDGWKIWSRPITPTTQGADTAVTRGQFTHRAPMPLTAGNGVQRLFFRANESVIYDSSLYPGLMTFDARYVGSTTGDTRNVARLGKRGRFEDIGHYTYDTPKTSLDLETKRLYSRDTVGVFFPDTADPLISCNRDLITGALSRVLPIQVRVVLPSPDR